MVPSERGASLGQDGNTLFSVGREFSARGQSLGTKKSLELGQIYTIYEVEEPPQTVRYGPTGRCTTPLLPSDRPVAYLFHGQWQKS